MPVYNNRTPINPEQKVSLPLSRARKPNGGVGGWYSRAGSRQGWHAMQSISTLSFGSGSAAT